MSLTHCTILQKKDGAVKRVALLGAALAATLGATTITLYQDTATGALYTTPGEGRVKLGEFVSKDELQKEQDEFKKRVAKELKFTRVYSKVPKLKINGVHYLGFTHIGYEDDRDDINRFETRRNYLQLKAYWNDTDYARLTLDTFQDDDGNWLTRLKYAYIYIDGVLPHSGVEFGQVHRPWIDWEEHHGWLYRSIAKTFVEERNGAHLTNSADLGVNLKTKTEHFSSELGLYNGEGYHYPTADNTRLSFEYRLTYHILGTGKTHVKPTRDTYADISVTGQLNPDYRNDTDPATSDPDFRWYAIHGVYNRPEFLIAAMYADATPSDKAYDGKGWSVNAEVRPVPKWSVFGRYDKWEDQSGDVDTKREEWIAGIAYTYNKYVKFIANVFAIDPNTAVDNDEETRYMFTSEVKW
jgi:hypothetical protein